MAKERSPVPRPTRVHTDRKKQADKVACRWPASVEVGGPIMLFSTAACEIGGVCRKWLPRLREDYGERLVEVVDAIVAPAWRKLAAEAYAFACAHGHDPSDQPWLYDRDGRRVGWACQVCGGTAVQVCDNGLHTWCASCDHGTVWRE